jgi:hypothetical protein
MRYDEARSCEIESLIVHFERHSSLARALGITTLVDDQKAASNHPDFELRKHASDCGDLGPDRVNVEAVVRHLPNTSFSTSQGLGPRAALPASFSKSNSGHGN